MSIRRRPRLNTIPAKEIKRRGISAVDELLEDGPVRVIQYDEPRYVVMTEEHYRSLLDAEEEAAIARIRASAEDVKAGRVRKVTAAQLKREFELDE